MPVAAPGLSNATITAYTASNPAPSGVSHVRNPWSSRTRVHEYPSNPYTAPYSPGHPPANIHARLVATAHPASSAANRHGPASRSTGAPIS